MNPERKWLLIKQYLAAKDKELITTLKVEARTTTEAYNRALAIIPPQMVLLENIQTRVDALDRGEEEAPSGRTSPLVERY